MLTLILIDGIACLAAAAAVAIAVSGGGEFVVGEHRVRAHSVGNLLLLMSLLAAVRYTLRGRVPFLGMSSLPLHDIGARARAILRRWVEVLSSLPARRAPGLVCALTLGVGLLKVVLAIAHPGFFSGDDVEIHEMTLGHAFGMDWPIWNLRSAFYPMSFLYPVQRLLIAAGVTHPDSLVLAGRLVVVLLSTATLPLLYVLARPVAGHATSLVAVLLLGTSSLHIQFGATELPRPVSALFIVVAYFAMAAKVTPTRGALSGIALGIAACMRFSEVIFVLPALVQLIARREWRALGAMLGAVTLAGMLIQGVSDYLYWGGALSSGKAIVDFTLVQGLSSRGYEAAWYYLLNAPHWTNLLVLVLAFGATSRRHWQLSLWVWLPVLALSILPHKEPRYLLPVVPLLSLLAAHGFFEVVARLATLRVEVANVMAAALLIAVPLTVVHEASELHFRRSNAEVRLAADLSGRLPLVPVVIEQAWRWGGHLYLGRGRAVHDLGAEQLQPSRLKVMLAETGAMFVAVTDRTCNETACGEVLVSEGFEELPSQQSAAAAYRLFLRSGVRLAAR